MFVLYKPEVQCGVRNGSLRVSPPDFDVGELRASEKDLFSG